MFNRIRISTTLFLILILCGILQIGSNGMSFWAFRDDLQRLNQVEQSNQQRAALAQTRAVMLQASTGFQHMVDLQLPGLKVNVKRIL